MQGAEVNLQRWQADFINPIEALFADGVGNGDLDAQTGVGVVACGVYRFAHKIGAGETQALFQLDLGQRQVLFGESPSPAVALLLREGLYIDYISGRAKFASFFKYVLDDIVKDGF